MYPRAAPLVALCASAPLVIAVGKGRKRPAGRGGIGVQPAEGTGALLGSVNGEPGADCARQPRQQREPGFQLAQKICADCHGIGIGLLSPNPAAPSFFLIANRSSTTELSLRAFVRTSHDNMPNIILEPAQVDDLVTYIGSLKAP